MCVSRKGNIVTPLVGVWIEIFTMGNEDATIKVTPLVGVWIEICERVWSAGFIFGCHSPCGSVD